MSFFEELKRRNVFRVGIAYAIASWLLLQLSDVLAPLLNLPETAQRFVLFALLIGFIPALIFAWAYEMTPDGIKKEKDVDRSQSVTPQTGRKMDRSIIVILALAVVFLLFRQFSSTPDEPDTALAKPAALDTPATATEKSVAVLPFVNMSSDPEQEYFSDGLSEELLNRLAKNDQLHVAARTSAFQFKGQNLDIADIGKQLNVAHVLEGSVRKAGNRLRITAQLIQVDNGYHLWSETYEREMDDVFAIQDEISLAISKAMEIELNAGSQSTGSDRPTKNLEAYNLYLRARYLLAQRGSDNMLNADRLFAQAVALDPGFVSAWAGKAFNAALLFNYSDSITIQESLTKTQEAAGKALELDPENAEAYTALGRALSHAMQWQESRDNYERGYELGPNDVGVINLFGDFLGFKMGDFDRAISLKQQAISLDPLSGVHASDLSDLLLAKGELEAALVSARRGVSLAPDSAHRMYSLVSGLIENGLTEEAVALLNRLSTPGPENAPFETELNEWWAAYYYFNDDIENLQKIVTESIKLNESDPYNAYSLTYSQIAFFSTLWQDPGEVVPWLDKALELKEPDLTFPEYFYLPERMSDDPRWLEFWDEPVLKKLLDIRRANPYPSIGRWKGRFKTSETME